MEVKAVTELNVSEKKKNKKPKKAKGKKLKVVIFLYFYWCCFVPKRNTKSVTCDVNQGKTGACNLIG